MIFIKRSMIDYMAMWNTFSYEDRKQSVLQSTFCIIWAQNEILKMPSDQVYLMKLIILLCLSAWQG